MATLIDAADALRSRYLFAALDAAATAGVGATRGPLAVVPPTGAGPRRYRQVQRAVVAASRFAPGGYDTVQRLLVRPSRLPIDGTEVGLIGYGSGVTVFLVAGPGRSGPSQRLVLKVYRRTLGRRLEVLLADARRRRDVYRRVAAWYGNGSPLLPTRFLVAHGPLLSLRGLVCIQEYVERPHRDVFTGLSEGELLSLVSRTPALRRQLAAFAEGTSRAIEHERTSVDLIGRDNLMVAGPAAEPRLVLLEHGVHDLTRAGARASAIASETRRRLEYLHRVVERVESSDLVEKEAAGVGRGR